MNIQILDRMINDCDERLENINKQTVDLAALLKYDSNNEALRKEILKKNEEHEKVHNQLNVLVDLKNLEIDYGAHFDISSYSFGDSGYDEAYKQEFNKLVHKGEELGINFDALVKNENINVSNKQAQNKVDKTQQKEASTDDMYSDEYYRKRWQMKQQLEPQISGLRDKYNKRLEIKKEIGNLDKQINESAGRDDNQDERNNLIKKKMKLQSGLFQLLDEIIEEMGKNYTDHKCLYDFNKDEIIGYSDLANYYNNLYNKLCKECEDEKIEIKQEILENKYETHEPLYLKVKNSSKSILTKYGDENYEKAYQQRKELNKLDSVYNNKDTLLYLAHTADEPDYDEQFQNLKNRILSLAPENGEPLRDVREQIISELKLDKNKEYDLSFEQSIYDAIQKKYHTYAKLQNQLIELISRHEKKMPLVIDIAWGGNLGNSYNENHYNSVYKKIRNITLDSAPQINIEDDQKTTSKSDEKVQEDTKPKTVDKAIDSPTKSDNKVVEDAQKAEYMRRLAADINMINQKRAAQQVNEKKQDKINNSYIGGKHFKPNLTDSEYIIFKKGGYLHIVGNFTSDWVSEHYSELLDGMNTDDIQGIKLWNKLNYGVTSLPGFDVKVKVSKDDRLKLFGDVDEIRYYNWFEEKEEKQFSRRKPLNDTEKIVDNTTESKSKEKKRKRVKKRKKAKKSLIQKFKELSKGKKALVIAALVALGVVIVGGTIQFGPAAIAGIQYLMNPDNVNTVSSTVQHVAPNINYSDIAANVSNAAQNASTAVNDAVNNVASSVDFTNLGGAGHQVFSNAYDAVRGVNDLVSNQWFSGNPVDVFNTATNEFLHLTQEQLHNPDVLSQLAQDPNNALLFGNSVNDPSGFVHLSDVIGNVVKHIR